MVKMVNLHAKSYRQTQRFIENPPDDIQVFEIYPPAPLTTMALGSRISVLNQDYHLGRRCGRYFLATIGHTFVGGKFGRMERKSYGVCRSKLNADGVNPNCFRRNHFLNSASQLAVEPPVADVLDNTPATEKGMMDNLDK